MDDFVEKTALTNILLYIGMNGMPKFLRSLHERLVLFNNVDSIEDPFRREIVYRQKRAFLAKMNLCEVERSLPNLSIFKGLIKLDIVGWHGGYMGF